MSFQQINQHCYYYHSSVNIGYIMKGNTGMLVDAGIDKSAIKKVLKELHTRDLPLTHLFITHAHADHYGGAQFIQSNYSVYTLAPILEEAIMKYPLLEPLYLLGGNDPFSEVQNKFLQGSPLHVDELITEGEFQAGELSLKAYLLPGHSYHQLALSYEQVLFASDAYFGPEILSKHVIPFVTDVNKTLESLRTLLQLDMNGAVPGHGIYEEEFQESVQANIDYHQTLLTWLTVYIREHPDGISLEQIIGEMCRFYQVPANRLAQWLLYRTACTAYVLALKSQGVITDKIDRYRWCFYPVPQG